MYSLTWKLSDLPYAHICACYTHSGFIVHTTYLLTPWCRVLLEKLTGLQLVKKFPAFHRTRRFITAHTSVRHLSLSWASPTQSIYPHPTSWRSILILSTHPHLGLPSGLLPSYFPTKTQYTPLSSPICATCPAHLILLNLSPLTLNPFTYLEQKFVGFGENNPHKEVIDEKRLCRTTVIHLEEKNSEHQHQVLGRRIGKWSAQALEPTRYHYQRAAQRAKFLHDLWWVAS